MAKQSGRDAECGCGSEESRRRCIRIPHSAPRSASPLVPLVVIGDDQIDAALARDLGLLDRGDAAVDGDDQLARRRRRSASIASAFRP